MTQIGSLVPGTLTIIGVDYPMSEGVILSLFSMPDLCGLDQPFRSLHDSAAPCFAITDAAVCGMHFGARLLH